jgi:hypothetical protein
MDVVTGSALLIVYILYMKIQISAKEEDQQVYGVLEPGRQTGL